MSLIFVPDWLKWARDHLREHPGHTLRIKADWTYCIKCKYGSPL